VLIIATILFAEASAISYGVDLCEQYPVSTWTCFKNNGYTFAIPRGFDEYGNPCDTGPTNVKNAWAAGISFVDVYFLFCPTKDPVSQVNSMVDYFNSHLTTSEEEFIEMSNSRAQALKDTKIPEAGYYATPDQAETEMDFLTERFLAESKESPELKTNLTAAFYGMIWIDIETDPVKGCEWGKDYAANCQYVQKILNQIKARGKDAGMYASSYMWNIIMGSNNACPQFGTLPLWYPNVNGQTNYNDFSKFGGWTKPAIKQYVGNTNVCGANVDKNFY